MKRSPLLGLMTLTAFAAVWTSARNADAEPYRLRADAFAMTNSPNSPVGLIVLHGEDRSTPWLDTEAVVWGGVPQAGGNPSPADALIVLARLHDARNRTELFLGRQMVIAGALRPIHLDGARARAIAPTGTIFEAFAGIPTQPQLSANNVPYGAKASTFDWVAGGRVAQNFGYQTILGLAYLQRRSAGYLDQEEVGADFASAALSKVDVAGQAAWNLITPGFAEIGGSAALRFTDVRAELYAKHRSPSRLLPATSLFSALGDIPSEIVGTAVRWRVAPRLDVMPMLNARYNAEQWGADVTLRTALRLDDDGAGVVTVELRRQSTAPDRWWGARLAARVPLSAKFHAATELELVKPDEDRGKGTLWPWGLLALGFKPAKNWETSVAVEASSSPRASFAFDGLLRLTRVWGTP